MSLEKKTLAARYDEENVEFILWLAKQADGGYGVKKGQLLNRGWSFLRALYMLSEDALTATSVQRLLCLHGLPRKEADKPGLSLTPESSAQARLFFSRLSYAGLAGSAMGAWAPPVLANFRFPFAARSIAQ